MIGEIACASINCCSDEVSVHVLASKSPRLNVAIICKLLQNTNITTIK